MSVWILWFIVTVIAEIVRGDWMQTSALFMIVMIVLFDAGTM